MTRKQRSQLDKAIERAHAQGIRLVAVLGTPECPIYYTTSSAGESHLYKVTRPYGGQELQCSCPATGICKHRAIVHEHLMAEYEAMQEPTYTVETERTDSTPVPSPEEAYQARLDANKAMYQQERIEAYGENEPEALIVATGYGWSFQMDGRVRTFSTREAAKAAAIAAEANRKRETALLDTGLRFDPHTGLALAEVA